MYVKFSLMKYILTIAASDNSGGAGIQQDLKIAQEIGFWGLSAITGITVQNFEKLQSIHPSPPKVLQDQIEMNLNSFQIECVKIGAICSEDNIKVISSILTKNKLINVVLDTVFAPSKGKEFFRKKSIKLFKEELLPLVHIITPNKNELSLLAETEISDFDKGLEASKKIIKQFDCNIYLKGGHFTGNSIREALITKDEISFFEKERLNLKYSHGTGCTFSTALSCFLGDGINLKEACIKASEYVSIKYKNLNLII